MGKPGVVFLMYHELAAPGRALAQSAPGYVRYVVDSSNFMAQMKLLKKEGWQGVSVGEATRSFSDKTVAITFDDGSETDILYAAPILHELGFGATFYITSGWSGRPGYLAAPQLRELSDLGFEIGSHSMNHLYLTDLDDSGLQREIGDSKASLERVVGKPVEHFSCPGGRYNTQVAQIARNHGYRTVATSETKANTPSSDLFALGRVAVMRSTSMAQFRGLSQGRGLWRSHLGVGIRRAVMNLLGNSTYDRLREQLLRRSSK